MTASFKAEVGFRNGAAHVTFSGEFDTDAARMVAEMIHRHASQGTRVFVNVDEQARVTPGGGDEFKRQAARLALPSEWVFFKGEKTLDLAPQGYKVLIRKETACSCTAARCGNGGCGKGTCCKGEGEKELRAEQRIA